MVKRHNKKKIAKRDSKSKKIGEMKKKIKQAQINLIITDQWTYKL